VAGSGRSWQELLILLTAADDEGTSEAFSETFWDRATPEVLAAFWDPATPEVLAAFWDRATPEVLAAFWEAIAAERVRRGQRVEP